MPDLAPDLVALGQLSFHDRRGLTLVEIRRDEPGRSAYADDDRWVLHAALKALTHSETEDYLQRKLAAAGCPHRIFTTRSITRLQSLSSGNPRNLERLATLSLSAAANRGLEAVSPDLVDGVARELELEPGL